ncbi:unnamed protein product [Amoebophrya sp. A25]|nr:unnamed protein product [Amoebophrya sp. A25]|eukprot:GSA25T00017815001.1
MPIQNGGSASSGRKYQIPDPKRLTPSDVFLEEEELPHDLGPGPRGRTGFDHSRGSPADYARGGATTSVVQQEKSRLPPMQQSADGRLVPPDGAYDAILNMAGGGAGGTRGGPSGGSYFGSRPPQSGGDRGSNSKNTLIPRGSRQGSKTSVFIFTPEDGGGGAGGRGKRNSDFDEIPQLSDMEFDLNDATTSPTGKIRVGGPRLTERQNPDAEGRGQPAFTPEAHNKTIEINEHGVGVDKEYLQKMKEAERGHDENQAKRESKELSRASKELNQAERAHETKVQTFLLEQTDDQGLEQRKAALTAMQNVGERDTRGAQHKEYSKEDQEMLAEIDDVKAQLADDKKEQLKDTMQLIEEQLVVGTGLWSRILYMKRQEERRREQPDFVHPFPKTARLVQNTNFEIFVVVVMLTNAVTLALSAEKGGDERVELKVMEHIFTFFFMMEITARIQANGWPWLFDFYNMCDLGLVFLTGVLVMWILEPAGVSSEFMRNFSILRLLRLFKVARAIQTIEAFDLIWRMLRAFLASGRLLFWACVDFMFLAFLFGIFFCVIIGKDENVVHDDTIADLFGDVPKSMVTAIQVGTRNHWSDIARHVREYNTAIYLVSISTIVSINFVLFNIVSASMILSVFSASAKDREIAQRIYEHKRVRQWRLLKGIFKAMDQDGSGQVGAEELDEAIKTNKALQRKLAEINLSRQDLADLWLILDTSGDGELDIDEFLDGMRQMEGSAKSYDMVRNNTRTKTIYKRILKVGEFVFAITPEAKRLNMEVDRLHNKMMLVFSAVRPLEKRVLSIVRLGAEEFGQKVDEYGMPVMDMTVAEMNDAGGG